MAITVKHKFVSAIPDGTDTSVVRPSNWNDDHDLVGTVPVSNGGTGADNATTARANLGAAASGVNSDITSMSGITGGISSPDYIAFDTTYATPLTAGQLGWDGNNTLAIGMAGGNVTQHIGEDLYFYYKATSAVTKGQVVMFTGAVGASGVPTGAPATGITDGTYIMGIAAESVALNGFGLVQAFGELRNVNTTGYADGDILWYDPAVTGGLTKTKPVAPNVKVQMAAVINGGSSGGGTILIRIDPGSQLGGTDSNVQITSVANGNLLTYDGGNGYWKNTDLTAGTGISVSKSVNGVLTVTNTSPSSGGTVTSVTGTAPVSVATGTTTPVISMAAANGTTNGYLTSTDWTTFNNKGSGTVTSVSFTGGIVSVATATTTPALTVAGTSGGIPYFASGTTWASSGALTANALMIGGGAGAAPSTTSTGAGILTFLGTPSSANLAAAVTDETGSGALVFGTNPTFTGFIETVYAVSGTTPALSPTNGTIQTWTLSGSSTPTAGTWTAGASLTLQIIASTNTVTWSSVPVSWIGGSAPTLSTTGTTVVELWKVGTTVYGALVGSV